MLGWPAKGRVLFVGEEEPGRADRVDRLELKQNLLNLNSAAPQSAADAVIVQQPNVRTRRINTHPRVVTNLQSIDFEPATLRRRLLEQATPNNLPARA